MKNQRIWKIAWVLLILYFVSSLVSLTVHRFNVSSFSIESPHAVGKDGRPTLILGGHSQSVVFFYGESGSLLFFSSITLFIFWVRILIICIKTDANQFSGIGLGRKTFWILIIILLPVVGATIYYFGVMIRERIAEDRKIATRYAAWTSVTLCLLVGCIISSILGVKLVTQKMNEFSELAFGEEVITENKNDVKNEAPSVDKGKTVIRIDGENNIWLNGNKTSRDHLVPQLKSLAEELKMEIQTTGVVIQGNKSVRHGAILDIMNACAEAGFWDVSFSATKE